jgi:hypothetical protein
VSVCPECHRGHMQEIIEYATSCCHVAGVRAAPAVCPGCGEPRPEAYESDRYYECVSCGYVESARVERALSSVMGVE